MKKIIITGGPHTGKTTLLDALRQSNPELHYVPEPAAEIIQEQHQKVKDDPKHKGIFPWNNYPGFGKLVIARSLQHSAAIPKDAEKVIFDRSLIDNNAYARIHHCEFLLEKGFPHIQAARYSVALVCDFVGTYTQTEIRAEPREVAEEIQAQILRAYEESGLPIIHIPSVSVEERVELVQQVVAGTY